MQHAVGRQESDLLPDRSFSSARLSGSLFVADKDLAQIEPAAVRRSATIYVRNGPGAAVPRRDRLAERQHVGRLVDPPESLVEGPHLFVGQEGDMQLGVARQTKRPNGPADRLPDRSALAWRLAAD